MMCLGTLIIVLLKVKINILIEKSPLRLIVEQIYRFPGVLTAFSQLYAKGMTTAGFPTDAESYEITVNEIPIHVAGLADALVGTTIAQISDLHMGAQYRAEHLTVAVELINEMKPDFLCMTGDYVGSDPRDVEMIVDPLQRLAVPAFAIMGNHDYKRDSLPYVLQAFEPLSIPLLRNQAVQVKNGLWIVGLDDLLYGEPNLEKALQHVPDDDLIILLVHEPDYFQKISTSDLPIALQLSGHTHGGQIQLPSKEEDEFGRKMWTPRRVLPRFGTLYPPGLVKIGARSLYTNRGLGFTGPPIRINCRPEITLFTLVSDEPSMLNGDTQTEVQQSANVTPTQNE